MSDELETVTSAPDDDSGGQVIYMIDTSELERIGNLQLEKLEVMTEILSHEQERFETFHSLCLAGLVILGAILGAIVFRHLRK